jgi:hypothetical protein
MGKIRETLIGGVIALLISPVTIFIGYQLNDYLSKDKITIEHVELVARRPSIQFPFKLLRELNSEPIDSIFQTYMHNYSYISDKDKKALFSINYMSLRFIEKGINKAMHSILTAVLKGFIEYLSDIEESDIELIENLENYEEGKPIEDIIKGTEFERAFLLKKYETNEEEIEAELNNTLKLLRKRSLLLPKARKIAQDVLSLIDYVPKRTGSLMIKITLLNSGNTDGLLRDSGELKLENHRINIPIKTNKIVVVKRRSVAYLTFQIDEGEAKTKQLRELKELVKLKSDSPIFIELENIREDKIRSKTYTLPITD